MKKNEKYDKIKEIFEVLRLIVKQNNCINSCNEKCCDEQCYNAINSVLGILDSKTDNSYRVVVVDDDDVSLKMITIMLEREGHTVRAFNDVGQANSSIFDAINKPDLLIIDLNMPYMRGDDKIRSLKSSYCASSLPIAIFSAESNLEELAKDLGVMYIRKGSKLKSDLIRCLDSIN